MYLTEEQKRQLKILDEYLRYADLNEIQRVTSEAMTVEKLKGEDPPFPSVIQVFQDRIEQLEQVNIHYDQRLTDLHNDIQTLIRFLRTKQTADDQARPDLDSLSSRYGVW